MRRSANSIIVLCIFLSVFLFASFSLYPSFYSPHFVYYFPNLTPPLTSVSNYNLHAVTQHLHLLPRRVSSVLDSVSVLFPDWEVLLIVSPLTLVPDPRNFVCLYPNKATSEAIFSGILPSTNQTTFKCSLPRSCRRRLPFPSPILTRSPENNTLDASTKEMMRWTFLVYESFSTENDVVLFVKGVNNRQGVNRPPTEFKCVFGDDADNNITTTPVTSSVQEVFRCHLPDLTALGYDVDESIKISLEISDEKKVIPSVAYYTPRRKVAIAEPKSQLCASTMVYNVAKFLREWVMYHSKMGVDKFLLYDNDSDDDLGSIVKELNNEGYNVETLLWVWPKTQEAGFSHAALYAKYSCNWMMYVDVDEFVFAPSWQNSLHPSHQMLQSLLPKTPHDSSASMPGESIGQVSINCNEFGPSDRKSHPVEGVTQGYNCRRKVENRHKSIVLIDAMDDSLRNAVHHFKLKEKYRTKQMGEEGGGGGGVVVNHYKYQAWSEFKGKFRRRVSAYVVDWRKQGVNPLSKDRTPGLGFEAIEPEGWEHLFCEVRDDRLKLLTQRWFGRQTETGYKLAWQ